MKIKLRDMTKEQYKKWQNENCYNPNTNCEECVFNNVSCDCNVVECWIKNKNLYIDKFLDQEVEIENEQILTKEEREYLLSVIKPFRDRVKWIIKMVLFEREFITINFNVDMDTFSLPSFEENKYYKNMVIGKRYTLEELGL